MNFSIWAKHLIYWLLWHLLIGAGAVYFLWENRPWLLAVEAVLVISASIAVYLSNQLQRPVTIMNEGLKLIKDNDLGTHFIPSTQADLALLISTYNRMIDSLRRERQQLQEKQYFLEKIIKASQTALILLDYDGKIALLNPSAEQLFGEAENYWIGKPLDALPYPFGEMLLGLETAHAQMLTLASRKRLRCNKAVFFDQGFSRDFFTIDELTEELRLSEKSAYEKLIRVLSHEINNSLGAVGSLLQTCQQYGEMLLGEDREDYEMAIRVMLSRTEHLGAFMRSYADVIRLVQPKKNLHNLPNMLESIAALFKPELAKRQIVLHWQLDPEASPMVAIDRLQIEQVLVNIVKNAIEAIGHEGGYLKIATQGQGKQLLLCIEDSGPGIPAEVKANLFTPFFSTKENGQGIGLTMIQEILVQHGFEFQLDGPEGGPTQFRIWMD